jgi:hypothetical protein
MCELKKIFLMDISVREGTLASVATLAELFALLRECPIGKISDLSQCALNANHA